MSKSVKKKLRKKKAGKKKATKKAKKKIALMCTAKHRCDPTHSGSCIYDIDHPGSHHCSNCNKDF